MGGRGRGYVFICRSPYLAPSGGHSFLFYVFTDLILFAISGASGGTIFLLVKKDSGERHAKGLQSRPLESGFLYGGFGGETCPRPTSSP